MKKTIHYPVAFETEVPRHKDLKTVVAFVEGEVDIPEISERQAPVAIRVSDIDHFADEGAGTEFRVHNDRLLVDTGMTPEEFGRNEIHGIEKRGSLILPALEAMRMQFGFGDEVQTYPRKAMSVLEGLIWSGGVSQEAKETWSQMIEAERLMNRHSGDANLDFWRETTVRHAETFAVIGDRVWKETAEPCYTVSRFLQPGLKTRTADFFARLRNGLMEHNKWLQYRGDGRNFSAFDRERAYRHGRRAGEGRDQEALFPRIDLSSSDVPLIDFEAHEFERVSRLLVYDVADAFRHNAHGRGVEFFMSVPRELMDAFHEARQCLNDMDARSGITLEQERGMQALVDVLNERAAQGHTCLAKMQLADINEIFDDWFSREVSLETMVSIPMTGARR